MQEGEVMTEFERDEVERVKREVIMPLLGVWGYPMMFDAALAEIPLQIDCYPDPTIISVCDTAF